MTLTGPIAQPPAARYLPACAPATYSLRSTRSTEMYTLHEALAREHLRGLEREARQMRVARELAAARRWHRLEHRARTAQRRAHAAGHRHELRAV